MTTCGLCSQVVMANNTPRGAFDVAVIIVYTPIPHIISQETVNYQITKVQKTNNAINYHLLLQ